MGEFSTWHWALLALIILPNFLPLVIVPPAGANRFGERPPSRSFGEALQTAFAKFFDFSGRASRSEFWYFQLFQILLSIALRVAQTIAPDAAILIALVQIGLFFPAIALTARRLHDRNRSGWWQLLSLTGIGGFVLLAWMVMPPKDET